MARDFRTGIDDPGFHEDMTLKSTRFRDLRGDLSREELDAKRDAAHELLVRQKEVRRPARAPDWSSVARSG